MASGPASIVAYGADPTGVSNSATAVQNAVNSNSGKVFAPNGVYRMDSTVVFSTEAAVLEGAGYGDPQVAGEVGAVFKGNGLGSSPMFQIDAADAVTLRDFQVQNAQIGLLYTQSTGSRYVAQRIKISGVDYGVRLTGGIWESCWEMIKVINPIIGFDCRFSDLHTTLVFALCAVDGLSQSGGAAFAIPNGFAPHLLACSAKNITQTDAAALRVTRTSGNIFTYGASITGFLYQGNVCRLIDTRDSGFTSMITFEGGAIDLTACTASTPPLIHLNSAGRVNFCDTWFGPDAPSCPTLHSGGTVNFDRANRNIKSWNSMTVGTMHGIHDGAFV